MFACTLIGALWLLIAISMNFPTADVMMMNAVTLLFQTALLSGCKPLVNELHTTTAASSKTGKGFTWFFFSIFLIQHVKRYPSKKKLNKPKKGRRFKFTRNINQS